MADGIITAETQRTAEDGMTELGPGLMILDSGMDWHPAPSPVQRFLLFFGDCLDWEKVGPQGGWKDLQGSYRSLEEAEAQGRAMDVKETVEVCYWWWHVVDMQTGTIVAEGTL